MAHGPSPICRNAHSLQPYHVIEIDNTFARIYNFISLNLINKTLVSWVSLFVLVSTGPQNNPFFPGVYV